MKLGKLIAIAATTMLFAANAQEADTTSTDIGNKGWRPSITISNEISSGYYDKSILWDEILGDTLTINIGLGGGFNLSLYGRYPLEKVKGQEYGNIDADDYSDDDFDNYGLKVAYNYKFEDIALLKSVSLNLSYNIQKNADRYSEYTIDFKEFFNSNGEFTLNRREELEHYFSLAIAFEDAIPYLIPNFSFNINQEGNYYLQSGIKNILPLDFISPKLSMTNSVDVYYVCSGFLGEDSTEKEIKKEWDSSTCADIMKIKYSEYSFNNKAGFTNLVAKTSLDYSITDGCTASIYATYIREIDNSTNYNCEEDYTLYGLKLSFNL